MCCNAIESYPTKPQTVLNMLIEYTKNVSLTQAHSFKPQIQLKKLSSFYWDDRANIEKVFPISETPVSTPQFYYSHGLEFFRGKEESHRWATRRGDDSRP